MRELDEYHEKLIDRLAAAASEFRTACLTALHPEEPVEPGGWNVRQLAVHTRDTDKLVYGARTRRTLAEENPLFQNFDGERYMAEHYDPKEPLDGVLNEFVASIQSLVKALREMPEGSWARPARHETLGSNFTLQSWVERGLKHVEEHLATVQKAQGTPPQQSQ